MVATGRVRNIRDCIFTIRDVQVMLDRDLAELYGVPTKALNQAVKRNADRFPEGFVFQLTQDEFDGEHDIEHDIEFDDDINIIGYEEAKRIIDDYCSLTDISFDDSVTDKLCERISNVSRKV